MLCPPKQCKIIVLFCLCFGLGIAQDYAGRKEILQRLEGMDSLNIPIEVYVIVALCDNEHQGIVPVAPHLGNGDDPRSNLYWGAQYGVRTYLEKGNRWQLRSISENPSEQVLERCVFEHTSHSAILTADAYRGRCIQQSIECFLKMIAGTDDCENDPALVVYVGHNGLMDFGLSVYPLPGSKNHPADVMILACDSKYFFCEILNHYPVYPLLWTTALCAPEAYILDAALESWLDRRDEDIICTAAANAYAHYQKCSVTAAKRIFVTGW